MKAKSLSSQLKALKAENDNLRDELEDLRVVQEKFAQQSFLVEQLQKRIENLNYLINHGSERPRAVTLDTVRRLTGEIKSPTPEVSFCDITNKINECKDDDRS